MKKSIIILGKVSKFPKKGGWFYIEVPKKYNKYFNERKPAWGMFPIEVKIKDTTWKTKLMIKKGGNYFVAHNKTVREKENIIKVKRIMIRLTLI